MTPAPSAHLLPRLRVLHSVTCASDALPVGKQHIGCPGKNKNSIDAHFAHGGQAVDRIVNSGKHDVNCERALAQAIDMADLDNTKVLLFTPDRFYSLKLAAIPGLASCAQRIFEKGAGGKTESIRLRQQSHLGIGHVVAMSSVLIDEDHDAMPGAMQLTIGGSGRAGSSGMGRARPRGREQPGLADMQLRVVKTTKKG